MSEIHQHTLKNGLKIVAQPIANVQSLAMTLLVPAGVAREPQGKQAAAAMLSEMLCRGAGGKSAKEHSDALDYLGVQRSVSAQTRFMRLGATMIGSKCDTALPLLLDMILHPNLEEKSLEPARELCIQQIDSLADAPQQSAMLELRKQHFPSPLGRSPLGEKSDIEQITLDDIKNFKNENFVSGGSILAFAGNFDWDHLKGKCEQLLNNWNGAVSELNIDTQNQGSYSHLKAQTSQMHIAIAYEAPAETDENSKYQRAAAALLSGGMSGRLFTEVREKRGLCYAVSAGYSGQKDRGAMLGYAGTTTPRAQETLDVFIGELHRLSQGANQSEFDRAIVGMKSHLVMQGESTAARASAIATDMHLRGTPQTLEEMRKEVELITLENLNKYLANYKAPAPDKMTIVTIGPGALTVPK